VTDHDTVAAATLPPATNGTACAGRETSADVTLAGDVVRPARPDEWLGKPSCSLREVVRRQIATVLDEPSELPTTELDAAIDALVECWRSASGGLGSPHETPSVLLAQARQAARRGIKLGTVLRRWLVALECLEASARRDGVRPTDDRTEPGPKSCLPLDLRGVLMCELAEAYVDQLELLIRPGAVRRRELVEKLLDGRDTRSATVELGYDLDSWHLGVIAWGPDARQILQRLAIRLGCQLLTIPRNDAEVWAWLGAQQRTMLPRTGLESMTSQLDASVAFGAPAQAVAGWRLTHQEAMSAAIVGRRLGRRVTRCTDVLIDAAILQSGALAASLIDQYLAPLETLRIGGATARQTLTAYYACDRAVSSAASLLGVTRKTVERRLRQIEEALGRPIRGCLELEVALRLEPSLTAAG
jgi:hypothetical protein